jgi:hypothetical protein
MNDEQEKVLTMLEQGTIDSEQANELLEAMTPAAGGRKMAITAVSDAPTDIPDMDRFRRFWVVPFAILSGVTMLLAVGLRVLLTKRKGSSLALVAVFGLFLLFLGLTVLLFLSRKSTWVHIRVQEKGGHKIAISLPIPLTMVGRAIELARKQAQGEDLENLEMAAAAIAAAQASFNDPDADPIVINVDDEDAHVQVFFG